MNDACRILLICDDDLSGLEIRRMLGTDMRIEPLLGQGQPRTLTLEVDEVVLSGTWEIGVQDRHYQLCIISVASGASPIAELARHPTLRGNLSMVLYVVESSAMTPPAGALRPGRDRMLALPCSRATLLGTVERMLLEALAQHAVGVNDPRCLALVKALVDSEERTIRPTFAADEINGFIYPNVIRHVGAGVDQVAILERLVEHDLCTRVIDQRVRACPTCSCLQLIYGEACARCASVDFVRETIIHHFACAHMDTQSAFTKGNELICPKCRVVLHQIGRDYEKPTGCYRCQSCAFISTETRITARCLACQTQIPPEETVERLIYAYTLTAKADGAAESGDLAGLGMASVLRNHTTGLFAKSFFLFSLHRELERRRRYATAVSLVMVRSTRLEAVRRDGPDGYSNYVQVMWKAATEGLRTLDVPCVYDEGVLAIMLPATALAGAEVVAKRITEQFRAAQPTQAENHELVINTIEAVADHVDADAFMRDAIATLTPKGITASEVFVIEEDEQNTPPVIRNSWQGKPLTWEEAADMGSH